MPEFVVSGRQPQKNTSVNGVEIYTDGSPVSVQNPFSTDGDSVYAKDVDTANSSIGDFSGSVTDLFDNRTSTITTTTDNPSLTIALKRPIQTHNITIVTSSGNFSNVVITLKNAAGTTVETIDDSSNDTKYTSHTYALVDVDKFCVMTIQFMTTDAVTLSFLMMRKIIEVDAHLVALKPDGTITHINATAGGNLKTSVEELESGISDDSNTKLKVSPYVVDEFGVVSRMLGDNQFAGAPVVVDSAHHEIHCGDSYMVTRTADLANGASDIIIVNIPNEATKRYHFTFSIVSESECQFDVYEGATADSDGTQITSYNRNRNSANTTGCTFYHTPTNAAGGTGIITAHWGAGRGIGGENRAQMEVIAKNNTKYRIVLTNATATNNYVSWQIDHYIHPGI